MDFDDKKQLHEAIEEFASNLNMIGWPTIWKHPEGKEIEEMYDRLMDIYNDLEEEINDLEEEDGDFK